MKSLFLLLADGDGTVTYGLKAHFWIHRSWALNSSIADDDAGDLIYSIATNFRS